MSKEDKIEMGRLTDKANDVSSPVALSLEYIHGYLCGCLEDLLCPPPAKNRIESSRVMRSTSK